jgi:hypothetical protein
MRKKLYWLSDTEWKRLEPLLPHGRRGAHRVDDRRVGMLKIGRTIGVGTSVVQRVLLEAMPATD